jgi:3-oxoadipate enol-lactonase
MSSFLFRGKEVFYLSEGEGSPIVLLNGVMMSTKSWTAFVPELASKNRLIRVDFFDQGQSAKLINESYTQDLQVELLRALLDHLAIARAGVVGISYGGEVALQFAIRYPALVDRLIIFNACATTSPWLKDIGRGWIAAGETRDGQHYYQTTIPVIYSPHFYETKLEWMRKREAFLVPVFSNPEFLDQLKRLILSAESFDVRADLAKIAAKTLIVSAEMDYLTPVDNQEYLYHHISGSDWVKLPYAGHASMYEKPLLFVSLVQGYLNVGQTDYSI